MWRGGSYLVISELFEWLFGVVDGPTGGRRPRKDDVPDVRGLDVDDARFELLSDGFRCEVHRLEDDPAPVVGIVVAQIPSPGTRWNRAKRVQLSVLHPSRDDDIAIDAE